MSNLSGKLETFSLRQIMALMADAGATGELQVASSTITGRIFFESGSVAYGTTRAGGDSLSELDKLLDANGGDPVLSARPAIEEQLTEVLCGLIQLTAGTFDFDQRAASSRKLDPGLTFGVSDLLEMADERVEGWRKVHEVIPSTTSALRLVSDLPTEHGEVTVASDAWTVLATVAGGASIAEVADALDISNFLAAQRLAELVSQGLIGVVGDTDVTDEPESRPHSSTLYSSLESLQRPSDSDRATEGPADFNEEKWAKRLPGLGKDISEIRMSEPERESSSSRPPKPEGDPAGSRPTDHTTQPAARPTKTEDPVVSRLGDHQDQPTPRVEPKEKPVSFSKKDLTPEERDELIRNIGKGIYPSD